MTKLTEAQRDLLRVAAATEDGAIEAPTGTAAKRITVQLIRKGLMLSIPLDDGGQRILITTEGRAASVESAAEAPTEAPKRSGRRPGVVKQAEGPPTGTDPASASAVTPKGKIGAIVELLRRPQGATIADMMAVTNWQPHSIRGALAGSVKKQHGLAVSSTKDADGRVYRIAEEAAR